MGEKQQVSLNIFDLHGMLFMTNLGYHYSFLLFDKFNETIVLFFFFFFFFFGRWKSKEQIMFTGFVDFTFYPFIPSGLCRPY